MNRSLASATAVAVAFAAATTDTGHRASEPDRARNRAKKIDYGYRGTHVSTVAAKESGALAYAGPRLPSGYGLMDVNFRFLALENDDPGFGWRQFDVAPGLPRTRPLCPHPQVARYRGTGSLENAANFVRAVP